MNPVGILLLPVSALVLAGTTLSTVPGPSVIAAPPTPSRPVARAVAGPVVGSSGPIPGRGSGPAADPTAPGVGGTSRLTVPRPGWAWPLQPRPGVVRPFVRPETKYGTGHRGVDLAGTAGQEVRAVEAGTVTHVGTIAGRGTVSVLHPSGIRSTYEPVVPKVVRGSAVAPGAVLGRLEATGSHCAPVACLHLGAVRGDAYLDPLAFLLGRQRVRLLPLAAVARGQAPEG